MSEVWCESEAKELHVYIKSCWDLDDIMLRFPSQIESELI